MKIVDCSPLWLPYVCMELKYTPTALAQCIVCRDGKNILAGAVFDYYNGSTVSAHIFVSGVPSKEWFVAIHDYPFNALNVRKIVGQVSSLNSGARSLDEHLGFSEEARVKDYFGLGDDMIIYTMTKQQSVVMNSPRWKSIRDQIIEARYGKEQQSP